MSRENTLNSAEVTRPVGSDPLNLKLKLSQRSIVEHLQGINWNQGTKSPLVVEFDPTTACNLACPDCISRDLLNQKLFTRERIKELVQEMVDAGVKAVVLIGGGEPMAHPEIGWVIETFMKNNVRLGLTTNGLLLDKHLDLVGQAMSWTRVSMDAGTTEVYGRIRPNHAGKSEFDRAVKNMKALAKVKKGKLGYSFMMFSEGKFDPENPTPDSGFSNIPDVVTAAKLAKEIGCDYFEIKPMYNIHHYAITQKQELMDYAKQQVAEASKLEDEKFRVLKATKLNAVLNGEPNIEPKDYHRCAVSQLRTLVTPSGVYVCPYFRGRPDKKIGDVNDTSFKEMWSGQERAKVMEKLDPSVDCRMHCIRHDSNLILEDMIAGNMPARVVEDFDFFI